MNQFKSALLIVAFTVLSLFLFLNVFLGNAIAEPTGTSPLIRPGEAVQAEGEKPSSHYSRDSDRITTTLPILLNTPSTGGVPQLDSAVTLPSDSVFATGEITDTITVSFQGIGSGMEECSGDWGYQRINYSMDVDIQVVGVNPSQVGDIVSYELTNKTGTVRFYGTAEDLFWGEMTTLNFDRTQTLDLQNIEGILEYSTGKCSNLYIGFTVPASSSLPYSVYIQYDGALGIIRNTVNMPYPWNAGVGCLSNNYDIPGKDDFDYCKISLKVDKAPLPPGETTKIHASSCLPIDPAKPLEWNIAPVRGFDVKAIITPDGGLGETATISDVEGEGWVLITVTNPSYPDCTKKAALLIGCGCGITSEICILPGNAFLEISSIAARFNLGRTELGQSAGDIFLEADTPDPANATPQILKVYEFGNDLEILSDVNGLRQVVAPDAFVDITVIDAYSYIISFYDLADMGSKVGGYYDVSPSATPIVTWTIENPDASPTVYNRLRMTEDKNGLIWVSEYQWGVAENAWRLSKGNGLQVISRKEENIGGNRVVTETIEDGSANIASKVRTTYADITYNSQTSEEIIEIVEDPDGDSLTITRNWYQEPCAIGSCGRLESQVNPDGSWVKYEYDFLGRKILEIRSWLDGPVSSSAGSARAIYYEYSAQHVDDSHAAEDTRLPRKITEEILGNEVSRTFYVYTNNGDGSRTEIVERAGAPGADYGASGNLRTTTEFYPFNDSSADSWRIKNVTHPDGTRDAYTYEYGTYTPNADPTQLGTFTPGTGTDIQEEVVHGTISSPLGIAFKTTGERNISNNLGDLLLQRTYVHDGSDYWTIHWTVQTHDEFGHVLMVSRSDGTLSESTWDCCGKSSEVDSRGITRYFDSDDLYRLDTETKDAIDDIVTTYTYDAAGRRLTQMTTAGGLSQSSSSEYDGAGRMTETIDNAGLVTIYDYAAGGRITTVTQPGGATETTERYLDGRVKSITGTAVIARFYSYGVNADGTQWTRVDTGGLSSLMWEKTVVDMLGRTIRVEKPGFAGDEVTENFYDDKGQLIKTTTAGLADTLYIYDEIGNQIFSGLDLDYNDSLDPNSSDRINETQTIFALDGGNWWQETEQKVYAEDSSSTATVTGIQRVRLSGLGAGGLASETVTIDVFGNQTIEQILIDRSTKSETRIIDYPDSNIDGISVSENGQLMSQQSKTGIVYTYGYDTLERRTGVTDPRTGTSITHYNNNGQVEYVEDSALNFTQYTYDANSGRRMVETNPFGKVTRYEYNDRGQTIRTWGDTAYPVEHVYDDYGRMAEMHTWREGTGWSGETWPSDMSGLEDVTRWHYQETTGLLTSKEDNDGQSVSYTYATGGKLATRTWARLEGGSTLVTTYNYDPDTAELLDTAYSDSTPDITLTYNRLGAVETVTDAIGTRTFTYNTTLQLESEAITGLINKTLTRAYETAGLPGRPAGFDTGPDYSVTYGYDDTGRFNTVNWNAGTDSQTASYSYLADSDLIEQLSTDHGHLTTYTYEPNRNLRTQVRNEQGSTLVSQYDYQYDTLGRRTSVQNAGLAFDTAAFNLFDYNGRNELTESGRYTGSDTGSPTDLVQAEYRAYDYDPIGNRTQITEATDLGTYTSNPLNQYDAHNLPGGGTHTYTYDLDGNLTGISGTANIIYTYNAENRLISTEPQTPVNGDRKVEFTYGYMGRRVQKIVYAFEASAWIFESEKLFLYDGWNPVCEITNNGTDTQEKHYIWGLDLSNTIGGAGGVGGLIASVEILAGDFDADGDIDGTNLATLADNTSLLDLLTFATTFGKTSGTFNYFYDGNGNVGQLVPADYEAIASHYEYDPYGNTILATGDMAGANPYRFSTKYYDGGSGLYYYGYRYYSPELGRWVNRDPIGESGGTNLYGFVWNDGIGNVDLLGYDFIAVGTRPVHGLGGILPGLQHMSIYLFEEDPPCTKKGEKFTFSTIPPSASAKGFYELLRRADLYERNWTLGNKSKSEEIAVSVIYDKVIKKSKEAEHFVVISSDADYKGGKTKIISDAWSKRIVPNATTYEYALQSKNLPPKLDSLNWPKTKYVAKLSSLIFPPTNSNTFIRVLARLVGGNADDVKGKHVGAQYPSSPVDKHLKVRGYPVKK